MVAPQTMGDVYELISLTISHACFETRATLPATGFQPVRNLRNPLFFFLSSSGWCCDTDRPALSSLCRRRWELPIIFRLRGNYKVAPSVSAGAFPVARRTSLRVLISCKEIWWKGKHNTDQTVCLSWSTGRFFFFNNRELAENHDKERRSAKDVSVSERNRFLP